MAKYSEPDPNEDIVNQVSGYMRVGADWILAAAACGVSEEKARRWWAKAEECAKSGEQGIYLELYETVRNSLAQAEVIALQRLSAEGGAAGARWLLERMNPDKYGRELPQTRKESKKDGSGVPSASDLLKLCR